MTIIIAACSDLHVNSTIGLSLPRIELDDGGEYKASRTQHWLNEKWGEFWDEVEETKRKQNAKLLTLFNGDIADIDAKGRTYQLITRNKSSALRHAAELLDRPLRLSDRAIFVRGTSSHVGKSGWTEEELARDCDCVAQTNNQAYSWEIFYANIGGLVIDVRHFVQLGTEPRTLLNPLGRLSERLELYYHRERKPIPQLAIRGHRHTWADSGTNYPVRIIATGCFAGIPDYYTAHGGIQPPGIGGLIVEIKDHATWTARLIEFPMPPPRIWTFR